MEVYTIYKGLQSPLVFKMFKGKYIYYAMGGILAGIVLGGLAAALLSSIAAIVIMAGVTIPVMLWVLKKQKGGLHSKTRTKKIVICPPDKGMIRFFREDVLKKKSDEEGKA